MSSPESTLECPNCGYDLSAVTLPKCPECNVSVDRRVLTLQAAVLKHRALWLLVMALAPMYWTWRNNFYVGKPTWMLGTSEITWPGYPERLASVASLMGFCAGFVLLWPVAGPVLRKFAVIFAALVLADFSLDSFNLESYRRTFTTGSDSLQQVGLMIFQLSNAIGFIGATGFGVILAITLARTQACRIRAFCRVSVLLFLFAAVLWTMATARDMTTSRQASFSWTTLKSLGDFWSFQVFGLMLTGGAKTFGTGAWASLGVAALLRALRSIRPGSLRDG